MAVTKIKILGVMTGTSCDGLDAACIEIAPQNCLENCLQDCLKNWKTLWYHSSPYPASLRKRVLEFQKPNSIHTAQDWMTLHRDLGLWYGNTLLKLIKKNKQKPHVIANHGQTVAHFPSTTGYSPGTTLQLGDPTHIATATGLTVISHFREGDLAAGGQGAPLAPLFHQMIARRLKAQPSKTSEIAGVGISIHNLGGISNLTYLGPKNRILAFDTGPANIWMDAATEQATQGKHKFDREGKLAKQGIVDQEAVIKVLKHPFFSNPPPKSTGRDDFPFETLLSTTSSRGVDLIATATRISSTSIAQAYQKWIIRAGYPLKEIYFCGGGAKNKTLLQEIGQQLKGVQISTLSSLGLETQAIEASAFAVFGYLSLQGKPLGGQWTGARSFGPPGQITPGKNWNQVVRYLQAK